MEVINYYELKPDPVRGVHILDTRNGKMWHFRGGYGDLGRHITQPGCAHLIEWLGDRRETHLSIIEALDAMEGGDTPAAERIAELENGLRLMRRWIESEERPGDRTMDIYNLTAKLLPY
jgi:hypothetical protein